MTIYDLFTVMTLVLGIALLVFIGHAVWSIMHDDLHWFDDQVEEDEHIRDLPAPWNRKGAKK